ncbi:peptidyl-prolyl cis-trans isomerase fkbp16- chloroplastic-like [Trifolium pratense]|uniref:peptidylprolyl isomerase n=2 Tax=Trifolium pratense TaxID=57577 RepID=A0A2K3LUZ2_TRIPR|nr:peptidyl-prolyl cis-trans isomerase fkbp16- chloroplastic-like [Trifolium pratense]PNX91961.1 peptidyl-prolyl cis-trans isomerase fkbp16- chloroplastic-like [Trifolium pratense]PNY10246.1 peptidyl-prolyl cis-trans isomerase fkbp16- chloroplastic-like [Trifolium pratense]CAJ2677007.1 unnamed protein product [Trifolium pratense]
MALSFSLSSSVTVSNRFPSCCISKLNSKSCNGFNKVVCSSRKDKNPLIGIGLGFVTALVTGLTALNADATRIEYYATVAEPKCELSYAKSGLGYCDAVEGFGDEAPLGELIIIHYTARFDDGIVFDSSYKRGRPLTMRIGVGKVIKGLDQGILGGEGVPPMRIGGKRQLLIPPLLAYGPEPAGCFSGDCNIPGNATLLYDIKFVGLYTDEQHMD